jgi:hypothetical protein
MPCASPGGPRGAGPEDASGRFGEEIMVFGSPVADCPTCRRPARRRRRRVASSRPSATLRYTPCAAAALAATCQSHSAAVHPKPSCIPCSFSQTACPGSRQPPVPLSAPPQTASPAPPARLSCPRLAAAVRPCARLSLIDGLVVWKRHDLAQGQAALLHSFACLIARPAPPLQPPATTSRRLTGLAPSTP